MMVEQFINVGSMLVGDADGKGHWVLHDVWSDGVEEVGFISISAIDGARENYKIFI